MCGPRAVANACYLCAAEQHIRGLIYTRQRALRECILCQLAMHCGAPSHLLLQRFSTVAAPTTLLHKSIHRLHAREEVLPNWGCALFSGIRPYLAELHVLRVNPLLVLLLLNLLHLH